MVCLDVKVKDGEAVDYNTSSASSVGIDDARDVTF